jgi:hypothetical protein
MDIDRLRETPAAAHSPAMRHQKASICRAAGAIFLDQILCTPSSPPCLEFIPIGTSTKELHPCREKAARS